MKTIIAGSRGIRDMNVLLCALELCPFTNDITEIVSGAASGVDKLGELAAEISNIPIKKFPANWDKYGKRAGYMRNAEMAEYSEALIAVWDGTSKGTSHMIELAKANDLKIFVYDLSKL